jgi:hypothetical protein
MSFTPSAGSVRNFAFTLSTTQAINIEIGQYYMRFYVNGAPILAEGTEFPYLLETQFMGEDVMDLQLTQINDVVYITHPDYSPKKLSRLADNNWTMVELEFTNPPMGNENLTAITMTPSHTSGTVRTVTASTPYFQSGHVGGYLRIGHRRENQSIEDAAITGNDTSATIDVLGEYNVRTYGIWTASIYIEAYNSVTATWDVVRKFEGKGDRNVDSQGETSERKQMRIRIADYVANTAGEGETVPDPGRVVLEASEYIIYGTARITGFTSSTVVTVDIISQFYAAEASTYWSESAWSEYRGYPWCCGFHAGRLAFGGSNTYPTGLWLSVAGDYENFLRGDDDESSIFIELAGEESNEIQWLASMRDLIVGTTGSEWVVRSNSAVKGLTPASIEARIVSYYGSEYIRPLTLSSVFIFVQRKGHRLIEWTWDGDAAQGTPLTLMSPHVGNGGIHQIAFVADPIPIIWMVNGDGYLCGLTYDRQQEVLAWHVHTTDGEDTTNAQFESVAGLYGQKTGDDEVYVIVNRDGIRSVERFRPSVWTAIEDCYYVDSGLSYSGTPLNSFTGLPHLVGREIQVLADGVPYTATVDAGGSFSLPVGVTASKVHAGLAYASVFQPMRLDVDGVLGPHVGRNKSVKQMNVRVSKSAGMRWSCDGDEYDLQQATATPELTTGDLKIDATTGFSSDPEVTIKQVQPLPLTIDGIVMYFDVTGKT